MNVRLDDIAKSNLDFLKKEFGYQNFSSCITEITYFFKNNKLSPRDPINQNLANVVFQSKLELKQDILDLRNFIKEDSQSLRKRHGAIERDYFIPLGRKMDSIYKFNIDKSIELRNEELEKRLIPNEENEIDNSDTVKKLQEILESRNRTINEYEDIIKKQDDLLKEYFNTLKTLNENIKYEKGITGKKIFINLSLDEVNELFKIIP